MPQCNLEACQILNMAKADAGAGKDERMHAGYLHPPLPDNVAIKRTRSNFSRYSIQLPISAP